MLWFLLCLLSGEIIRVTCRRQVSSEVEDLKKLMANVSYDGSVAPAQRRGAAVKVAISMYVNSIGEIDESKMEYTINLFFRQRWTDPRVNYTDYINDTESISVPQSIVDHLWKPDAYFENSKDEKLHVVTAPNVQLRIYRDGVIFYSQRVTVRVWCEMDLSHFPLDNQTCQLRLSTYKYVYSEMYYVWDSAQALTMKPDLNLPTFMLTGKGVGDCTTGYNTGRYSCVYAQFHLNRKFTYYVLHVYVPSIMIVVLSWVSFWLDPLAVPGRTSLGVMTILTMSTTMASAATAALPKVSYAKALDIWNTGCMCFLFMALVEFAIANTLARQEVSSAESFMPHQENPETVQEPTLKVIVHRLMEMKRMEVEHGSNTIKEYKHKLKVVRSLHVDCFSRIMFPLGFGIFNALYWSLLLAQWKF